MKNSLQSIVDLIDRLLPTVINDIIHFKTSPFLILIIVAIFLASFTLLVIGSFKIMRRAKVVTSKFKKLKKGCATQRQCFTEIENTFKNDKILSHQWYEFNECVVIEKKKRWE